MNLPFLKKKEEVKEYFLVLLLSTGKIGALLFEKTGSSLSILGKKEEIIDRPLDTLESNKLIESSDIVISDVESGLPEGFHLEKTIFALPQRWVIDGKIKKDHLLSLKRVCESLELTPVGFIVSIEALSSHLYKMEGAPITAIFIEIGEKIVTVSIVKNGTLLFTEESEINESPVKAVEEILLTQEITEVLPAKIILLNFDKAKDIQQEFLAHSWNKQLPFLHIPQVTVLSPEIESQAIITGVASQMGFEHVGGVIVSKKSPVEAVEEEQEVKNVQPQEDEMTENEVTPELDGHDNNAPETSLEFSGENVGFFKETDVRLKNTSEPKLESNVEPVINDRSGERLEESEQLTSETAIAVNTMKSSLFSRIRIPQVPSLAGIIPSGNKFYLYPILVVILLVVLGILYYVVFEKATVTIYLEKNVITKDMPITFSTDSSSSVEKGILRLETREITIEGEESKKATGVKKTGEKAKGEITIYNKTESKKVLPKGAVLVGPNNLTFTLVEEVSIASTSSFSTSFSSAKGKVESSDFGKENNLPSGTNFSFENTSTSDIFAKNDSAFSGGTSKEITVVSKEDLTILENSLVSELTKDAMAKAASEKDTEEDILDNPLSFSFESKTYSKKEGDEASDVKLTGSIVFDVGVYKKSDLLSFAKEATLDKAGTGEFSEKESQVSVKDISDEDGEISATFVFSSVYLPKVETSDLSGKIAGKNSDRTYEILEIEGVQDIKVEFTRSIPFFPKILPFNKNNITIELQAK